MLTLKKIIKDARKTASQKIWSGKGLTFMQVLLLLLIALKLCGQIDWSWFWVMAPFWGDVVFKLLDWLAPSELK